ncbi:MAG: hypothetical protein EOM20_09835 [Spartobacteria bacterium]|nr:hypothetical protein [Spartobacteria bacterium]
MKILQYNDLAVASVRAAFNRTVEALQAGDFRAADVKKLKGTPYYRAKLNDADRLLFRFGSYGGETFLLLLETILAHAYEKSRFLNGAKIVESKLEPVHDINAVDKKEAVPLPYVNPKQNHFHVLDKILSFDDRQVEAFGLHTPLILIGAAGSGKTVLTLEKLKRLHGDVLYVTLSAYLAENARNLYYSYGYENERQNVDFLSLREYVETLHVPTGRPITFRAFAAWFARHVHGSGLKDAHMVFEEFNGVLTGMTVDKPVIDLDEYLALGVKQSIFPREQRERVYALFQRYYAWMKDDGWYDPNLIAFEYLTRCTPRYDFAVVDEVQDITNIQLHLILKSLRVQENFVLCGDSNQIVHPNFFSWAKVKSLFYEKRTKGSAEIIRVLDVNYRNSPQVTDTANRLLLVKNTRFGSIDRESNYLVKSLSDREGNVELARDSEATRQDIDKKTARSTHFAVIVMREEDKAEAKRSFRTPLVFSVQEAKGLEYENIVMLNCVSNHARAFDEITAGVEVEDMNKELRYARAADKSDKSLEAYKFYTNALYVALTRAVRNVYLIESHTRHRLWPLLGLAEMKGTMNVQTSTSTDEDWKEEARKLEMQGKEEQAEAIRRTILKTKDVPWKVLTPDSLDELKIEALNPDHYNRQAKLLLFDYAVIHHVPALFNKLAELKFKQAEDPFSNQKKIYEKYQRDYTDPQRKELKNKLNQYGIDFRDPMNRTPLMIAAQLGQADLVRDLVKAGAHKNAHDNWGRNPLQTALLEAYRSREYATHHIGEVYPLLAPSSIKVKVQGRMIKIDQKHMEFFMLQSMIAIFQDIARIKTKWDLPAFETGDFVHALRPFPEHVIPERRKKRPYLSSILSKNEVNRDAPYNRFLFVRVRQGRYILNPLMDIDIDDQWVNVYDLIGISTLEQETENTYAGRALRAVLQFVRKKQAEAAQE